MDMALSSDWPTAFSSKASSKIAMMEAKLRQMANSSSFAKRPALPNKPAAPRRGALQSTQSQRASRHGTRSISGKTERTKNIDSGQQRLTALPSIRDAESSDMMGTPPSSKQRSIPGVKEARTKGRHQGSRLRHEGLGQVRDHQPRFCQHLYRFHS